MRIFVYIAVSLDGYIAKTDGSLDWLIEIPNPDGIDFGFRDFINTIDAVVMGRKTFEKVLTFKEWPYSKRVFVLSNSLRQLPGELVAKAEITRGNPREILTALEQKGFRNVYVDGGKTIQGFLELDLIDEMIITTIPVLLGNGIPLFGKLKFELKFEHVETQIYLGALVKSCYIRKRD
jgi:dihydrofolate reductase